MARLQICVTVFLLVFFITLGKGFLPNQMSLQSYWNPDDYSHEDITKLGILKAVAKFLEDNPPTGATFAPGQLQNLDPLTATNLYNTYYGETTSAGKLHNAMTEIVVANSRVENDYLTNAVYHMSGEEIQQGNTKLISLRSSMLSVLRADTTNFQTARAMIGEYLHLLQDFYSNTNWVELEGDIPYEDLGLPNRPFRPVASSEIPTCQSCPADIFSSLMDCQNNLICGTLLTSGYKSDQTKSKPTATTTNTGKCSHGGIRDDSRVEVATGGINKKTSLPEFSPHHYLHDQAAQAALQATLNFFIAPSYGLLSEVGPESFKELLGLGSGNSLVFVIDISGSMSNDLQAVKQTTVQLVNDNAGTVRAPYNYILSTFSDPEFGPVRTTKDPNQMIAWLNALVISGGGDCPELCFSGIELALLHCLPESTIYIFTDADPKDINKYDSVVSLIGDKQATLTFLLTGTCSSRNEQEQSTAYKSEGFRQSRHVKTTNFYDQLAQLSGGSVFEGDKDEIAELTDVISVYVSNSAPVLLTKVSISSGVGRVVPLQVDSTLEEFVISLIGVSSTPDVTIETPEGTSQVFGTPDSEISVDVGNNRIYQIHNPEPGTWRLLFRDSQQYMLEVTGKSSVDFTYQFVKTGNHGVTLPIEGSPVAGVNTTVMIDVIGSENIEQLHSLSLLGREGRELASSATFPLGGRFGDGYYTSIVLPTQEFRVKVEGTDTNNGTFQRVHPAFISPQSFDVSLDGEKEQLFAGSTAKVYFRIVNHGSRSTFSINATDDASMIQSLVPTSITLMENDNTTGNVIFSAPTGTADGTTCTATLSVTGPMGSFNSIVIRMTVEPQLVVTVDDVLPICTIVSTTDNCTLEQQYPSTCQNHLWSFRVEVRDEGSGVYSFQATPVGNGTDFSHDSFTPGTAVTAISAQYRSNCCKPQGTITVADMSGNVAQCIVDYFIPTTPSPTTTPFPTTASFSAEATSQEPITGHQSTGSFGTTEIVLVACACVIAVGIAIFTSLLCHRKNAVKSQHFELKRNTGMSRNVMENGNFVEHEANSG